jgi:hypothetical protein
MINAPKFASGLGLIVHIRTKIRYDYSYIESAALQIHEDVLEVASYGDYRLNGVESAVIDVNSTMGPFTLTYEQFSDREHIFEVLIGGPHDEKIRIRTFKDYVNLKFFHASPENYNDSVGMLGAFVAEEDDSPASLKHGASVGRDGKTIIRDPIAFSKEWQVRDDEPQLFEIKRTPIYPAECVMPDPFDWDTMTYRRRLGEAPVAREDAEKACSHWAKDLQVHCVYDVMATGDLELAEAGSY